MLYYIAIKKIYKNVYLINCRAEPALSFSTALKELFLQLRISYELNNKSLNKYIMRFKFAV